MIFRSKLGTGGVYVWSCDNLGCDARGIEAHALQKKCIVCDGKLRRIRK